MENRVVFTTVAAFWLSSPNTAYTAHLRKVFFLHSAKHNPLKIPLFCRRCRSLKDTPLHCLSAHRSLCLANVVHVQQRLFW